MSYPPLPGLVTDESDFLSDHAAVQLQEKLLAFQVRTEHTLAVYIVPRHGRGTIKQWCLGAFNAWTVGRKGYDDGAVLYIFTAEGDRDRGFWWLTIGYGLERALSDREVTAIIMKNASPSLDVGDEDGAVTSVVDAIIGRIEAHEGR